MLARCPAGCSPVGAASQGSLGLQSAGCGLWAAGRVLSVAHAVMPRGALLCPATSVIQNVFLVPNTTRPPAPAGTYAFGGPAGFGAAAPAGGFNFGMQ